ncbi:MAG: hypothetical protein ACUVRK_13315 [Spirochaetota bacterium]
MNYKLYLDKIAIVYAKYKKLAQQVYTKVIEMLTNPPEDTKKRYRVILLVVSVLCIVDYAAISVLTDKNFFDIYPSLPALDTRDTIDIFVADLDAKSILKETRQVLLSGDNESRVRRLVKLVAEGSEFENTRAVAPIDIIVRHVWFYDTTCIIDCELGTIEGNVPYIPDSFKAFNKALEQTLSHNIPGITKVVLLEHGIYGKNLW